MLSILFAVSNHYLHYNIFLNWKKNQWYEFDDTRITLKLIILLQRLLIYCFIKEDQDQNYHLFDY